MEKKIYFYDRQNNGKYLTGAGILSNKIASMDYQKFLSEFPIAAAKSQETAIPMDQAFKSLGIDPNGHMRQFRDLMSHKGMKIGAMVIDPENGTYCITK
jgi:hypothetical protein